MTTDREAFNPDYEYAKQPKPNEDMRFLGRLAMFFVDKPEAKKFQEAAPAKINQKVDAAKQRGRDVAERWRQKRLAARDRQDSLDMGEAPEGLLPFIKEPAQSVPAPELPRRVPGASFEQNPYPPKEVPYEGTVYKSQHATGMPTTETVEEDADILQRAADHARKQLGQEVPEPGTDDTGHKETAAPLPQRTQGASFAGEPLPKHPAPETEENNNITYFGVVGNRQQRRPGKHRAPSRHPLPFRIPSPRRASDDLTDAQNK